MKPIWKGNILFGLIQIPVSLFDATKEAGVRFHLLRKEDLCPVKYLRVCQRDGEEVPTAEISRGYEYRKGDWVALSETDIQKANAVSPKTVEIVQFAREEEIPNRFFEKPYILKPAPEADRQYALFREALRRSGRVAIVRFIPRTRERLGVLMAEGSALYLNQIRFGWEFRSPEEFKLPQLPEVTLRELDTAVRLIEYLSTPLKIESYQDVYEDNLRRIVEEKSRKKLPPPKT